MFPVLCGEWVELGVLSGAFKYGLFGSFGLCYVGECCMECGCGECGVVGVVY